MGKEIRKKKKRARGVWIQTMCKSRMKTFLMRLRSNYPPSVTYTP
jgi:hypothetical protein